MTNVDFDRIKEATKQGYLEAMFEYDQYRKDRKGKKDPDLISTNTAYKLRGRKRVESLVMHGLLTRTSSGRNKYVSRSRLIELDNLSI